MRGIPCGFDNLCEDDLGVISGCGFYQLHQVHCGSMAKTWGSGVFQGG